MQQLITDIKQYEQRGPRGNNYEHMLQMVPVAGVQDASIVATLLYLKENSACQTFVGTDGLSRRPMTSAITHSLQWRQDQEVPYNIVISDNTGPWMTAALALGISMVRIYIPTAAKHNLKLLQKEISQQNPHIVLADYTQLSIIQKLLGQSASVESDTTAEADQYNTFAAHSTNPERTPEELKQMDQVILENSYIKECVRGSQIPVFISRQKVLAGYIPQRLIFEKSSPRAKLAIHGKCTWLLNPSYPVYGSYLKRAHQSVTKSFILRDYFREHLELMPTRHIHDTVTAIGNIHQLFLRTGMPVISNPSQIASAVSRAQNRNLQSQMESKNGDPCPICMNEYKASPIHSRVTFACCSAQCCNGCFETMVHQVVPSFGSQEKLLRYPVVRCFMCRKQAGSGLILEVTNQAAFPPGLPDNKQIIKDVNAPQVICLTGSALKIFTSEVTPQKTLVTVPAVILRETSKKDILQQIRVFAGLKGIPEVQTLIY